MATHRAARVLLALTIVVGALAVDAGAFSPTASAMDGAVLSADIVYRLDPERPAVEVEMTYRMTNVSPNRDLGGGRFEYFYFTGLGVPIDREAADIGVRVNSRDGDYTLQTDEFGFAYLDIDFGYELRYQRTATVVVTYSLLGEAPRTPDSQIRVNRAYASFPVYAFGDPGEVDVRIETPGGWDVAHVGSELVGETLDGGEVHRASSIDDPDGFFVFFTARNDEALDRTTVTVDEHEFAVSSWPSDDAWLDFVTDRLADGLPALEAVIGVDWPVGRTASITEATTSYLDGYAGFYDSSRDAIEIGEDLDPVTLLHELAHAWFSYVDLSDRFLIEGLAEEVAARAFARLDGTLPPLRTDEEIADEWGDFDPFPLLDWPDGWTSEADDPTESYGYAASQRVIRALWDEIGDDPMRELLTAVVDKRRAYQYDDEELTYAVRIGWEEFLDLAEQIGGSQTLPAVYDDLVLDDEARDRLEPRSDAVDAYAELVEISGTWDVPDWIRTSLARWQFETATGRIDEATETIEVRDLLVAELAALGLIVPDGPEDAYEGVTVEGLDGVRAALDDLYDAALDLATARAELTERLAALDLDVPELTQAVYADDPFTIVEVTEALADDADALVAAAAELERLLESSGLDVPGLDPTAFVDDPDDALELVRAQIDATRAVVDTGSANEAADSFLEGIGRIGGGLDGAVEELAAELAEGDLDEVNELSDDLLTEIDGLDDVGRRRVVYAAVAVGGLLVIVVALVWRRRRRRGATGELGGDEPGATDADALASVGADGPPGDATPEADAGEAGADDPGRG